MSLTDKVVKNTFYHFAAQLLGFIFPFLLTPIIISSIGEVEFGIYALSLGFIGTFGMFDLSISTSFIKFISEHYNKKETKELNQVINTGLFFYILFSGLVCAAGLLFAEVILSLINIPPDLVDTALFAVRISLVIFFIATSTTIFMSILVSLQKMYLNSLIGIIINLLNFGVMIVLLSMGYGLEGILWSQLAAVSVSALVNYIIAKKELKEMRLGFGYLKMSAFKKMASFGAQMQVSKLAGFASEKYDEFLLGYFSVLNSVTYFNLANRVARLGRFFPMQLFQQVAPVAAELNAREEKEKLDRLFSDTTKYLTIVTYPIFVFIFFFSDLIFISWMGEPYELSSYLLKILVLGQLINMTLSAPGNAIIPNLGIPKFLMYEGLINLGINLIVSFLLIMYMGILGAAIGSTIAITISSVYIYIVCTRYFKKNNLTFYIGHYIKPLLFSLGGIALVYGGYFLFDENVFELSTRLSASGGLLISGILFVLIYSYLISRSNYLDDINKAVFRKMMSRVLPFKKFKEVK